MSHMPQPTTTNPSTGEVCSPDEPDSGVHYDEPPRVFELLLDRNMNYSSGVYPIGDEDLDAAQAAKMERVARYLALYPGNRVLDVGCGWSGPALYFAEHYGCQVTGINLSPVQRRYGLDWAQRRGLADRLRVDVCNVLDMPYPDGAFDKIVFFESIIHMPEKDAIFARCQRLLSPRGRVSIQESCYDKESMREQYLSDRGLAALLGAIWAGLVPSTLHSPIAAANAVAEDEWRSLIRAFAPALIVSDRALPDVGVPTLDPGDLRAGEAGRWPSRPDFSDLRDLTYLQFTSGSTGSPKGLALHSPAIRSNLVAIGEAAPVRPDDTVVSWLPMYHDMGLFGGLLTVLHVGARGVYMDPSVFTKSPLFWLRVLQTHRATITTTSPSALQTCIDLLRRRGLPELDLSSLRQVICGSEPVPRQVIDAFHEVLVPLGVSATALKPVYGLAEVTLAVSFPPQERLQRVDRIYKEIFEKEGKAIPANADETAVEDWVSAGRPLRGFEVRIEDEEGRSLAERCVGRVILRSPSLMTGILEDGDLRPREDDWLDTGDLGYLAEGEIFVTGRRKDLIIRYGRNYSPERVEYVACLVDGIRRAAAFGVFDDLRVTEKMILVAEARNKDIADATGRDRLRLMVRSHLHAAGYPVDEIVLVGRPGLPRTSSGKIRRQLCRDSYLAGCLEGNANAAAEDHERSAVG